MLPNNHYKKWSNNENKKLMSAVKRKMSLVEIADNHGRSVNAIKLKIIKNMIEEIEYIREIEYKLVDYDKEINPSIKYLMTLSNLSKSELLQGFKKLGFDYYYVENDTEYEDYYINKYLC